MTPGLLVEGLASAWLPCSAVLLLPGLLGILSARSTARATTLVAFAAAALTLSWLRFSERGGGWSPTVPAILLALAALGSLRAGATPTAAPAAPRPRRLGPIAVGTCAGVAAAELWQPCVGAHFGDLLGSLPDRGVGGGAGLALYLLGVLAPLALVAAAPALVPDGLAPAAGRHLPRIATAGLLGLAVLTGAGLHHELIGRLVALSGT